jgi:hypothetical protein
MSAVEGRADAGGAGGNVIAVTDTSLSFDEKCDALMKRIDSGEVPSTLQLARTLELPLSYVEAAVAISIIDFIRHNCRKKHAESSA